MKTEPTEARCHIMTRSIGDGYGDEIMLREDAEEAVNIAFKEGQSSPKIDQLEWKRDCDGIWFTKRVSFEFGAMIQETKKGMFRLSYKWDTYFTPYDSLDEAKAAAQADFERRVMECLDL